VELAGSIHWVRKLDVKGRDPGFLLVSIQCGAKAPLHFLAGTAGGAYEAGPSALSVSGFEGGTKHGPPQPQILQGSAPQAPLAADRRCAGRLEGRRGHARKLKPSNFTLHLS